MTRRVLTASTVLLGLVALVAFVRAQEDGTQSVLKSINDSSQAPTLASPPPSTVRGSSQFSVSNSEDAGSPRARQASRPSLADRLRQVRESVSRESDENRPELGTSSPARPATTGPANATPRIASDSLQTPSFVGEGDATAFNPAASGTGQPSSRNSARRTNRSPIPSEPTSETPSETPSQTPSGSILPREQILEPPTQFELPAEPNRDQTPNISAPSVSARTTIGAPEVMPNPKASSRVGSLMTTTGPLLQVDTVGPQAIVVGKSAEYTITVTNHGRIAADNVYVRIGLPEWVDVSNTTATSGAAQNQTDQSSQRKLLWTVDRVASQGEQTLTLLVTPRQNRPFDLMVDWTVRPITTVAQIEVQQPRLEMAVFGPKNVLYGETATYTLQLTNPGTGYAENVAVEFTYGARRLEKKVIGDLAPGEQNEINVELTAQQAGELLVAAVATGTGGLRAEAQEDVLVRRADLNVRVIGSSLKFAGSVASYKLHVKNTGNATANGVVASILLPAGAKLLTGTTDDGGRVLQDIGALIPGAERVVTLQSQLTVPGENRLQVLVSSKGGLEESTAFVTRVEALADLKLTLSDPRGPTAVGDNAIYEVKIANRGTKAAEKISIVGQFSEGVEPVEANGGAAELVPGQVLFHPIPRLEPGDEITLKIVARADQAGNHRFRAQLNCTNPETQLIAEESTFFFGGDDTPTTADRSTVDDATE